jgi:coatomer subunit beta
VQSTIKVSSTDTGIRVYPDLDRTPIYLRIYPGVIFGNVVYDSPSGTDTHVVILNDVHADIMDYIQPATCSETAFRTMWTEFEWENKVNINKKNAGTLREFLDHLMKSTNMSCLTPEAGLKGDCQFLSANLYAKSVFGKSGNPPWGDAKADIRVGEDALANLSIEKEGENGPITGFVRIRSRSQGLALSLGSLKGLKAGAS